jgi:hypothetical protein
MRFHRLDAHADMSCRFLIAIPLRDVTEDFFLSFAQFTVAGEATAWRIGNGVLI